MHRWNVKKQFKMRRQDWNYYYYCCYVELLEFVSQQFIIK